MAGGGWEKVIVPYLGPLMGLYPDFPASKRPTIPKSLVFPKDRHQVKQLSPNHWEMGLAMNLLYTAAYGDDTDDTDWYLAVDTYRYCLQLNLRDIGLWTSEQCTGTPHGGFYLDALFAARMAIKTKLNKSHLTSPADVALISEIDDYTRRTFSYMTITADIFGDVICCGERMPKGPTAIQQTAVYREVHGISHINRRVIDRSFSNDTWIALRAVRSLLAHGDDLAGVMNINLSNAQFPFVSVPVTVERWDGGHRAFYSKPGGDGTCPWVWTNNGNVRFGKGFATTPLTPLRKVEYRYQSSKGGEVIKSTQ